jgi:uncharacterized damage-inducible protein DinB
MLDRIIQRLDSTPAAIGAMCSALTPDEATFKPPSGAWSILEIVCHLVDEETLDFRRRIDLTLNHPGSSWPPNNPEAWATEHNYAAQNLAAKLQQFADERARSIVWLRSLDASNWQAAYIHPRIGPVRAGELLVSWPAHDALHIRQIAKRLFELAARDGAALDPDHPFITRYAGEWGV